MTAPVSQYLLLDAALIEVTSGVTGRTISVNPDATRWTILPRWSPTALHAVRADFEVLSVGSPKGERHARRIAQPVFAARSSDELATALVPVIGTLRWYCWTSSPTLQKLEPQCEHLPYAEDRQRTRTSRNGLLLTLLWKHGLALAPMYEWGFAYHFVQRALPPINGNTFGPAASFLQSVEDTPNADGRPRPRAHMLARLLMATRGVTEPADLDQTVLRAFQPVLDMAARGTPEGQVDLFRQFRPGPLFDALHRACVRQYADQPDMLARIPRDRHLRHLLPGRGGRRKTGLGSPDFPWVAERHPAHAAWGSAAARYIASLENRVDLLSEIRQLDVWLRSWLSATDCPATPLAYCRRDFDGVSRVRADLALRSGSPAHLAQALRAASRFFGSVLEIDGTRPNGALDPAYRNPTLGVTLPRRGKGSGKGQTHRAAMPPWLLREIRGLLATDDWARQQDDYFHYVDPTSGLTEQVWSPVRLEFFRLRLLLPLRTKQVQLLDSGEGDTRIWEADSDTPLDGRWVQNVRLWAPPSGEERQYGLLRPIYDAELGRHITGLYISTNKTADRTEDFTDLGYEIPYEHPEVIALSLRLQAWQSRFNPSSGPRKRTELASMGEGRMASADVDAVLPGLHYLFRDPAMPGFAHEPVTQNRVHRYWLKILDECERRINARLRAGDPLTRPVQLITKREPTGLPRRAAFDLHSLRVSGLTELAMAGCPVHVLMMLAGHATWVMTLYYVKPTASHIQRELASARARAEEALGAESWEELAAGGALEAMRALRIFNDSESTEGAGLSDYVARSMDYGECPNGGSLCHIGGPLLVKNQRDGDTHGPVEGGMLNCTGCRFFASGPFYLGGLIARLNALSVDVVAAGDRLEQAKRARRDVLESLAACAEGAARRLRESRADSAVDEAEAQALKVAKAWLSTYRMIERCKATLRQHQAAEADGAGGNRALPVVLGGTVEDFSVGLERCEDYDLWQRVCEDSEVYPSVDATAAALRRAVRLDRVLAEAGEAAVFATLDAEERVAVGNLYGGWLRTKLGDADRVALMKGRATLRDFDLLDESIALLTPYRMPAAVRDGVRAPRGLAAGEPGMALAEE